MLKKEVLKANAALAGLTDEQIAAIEQLSTNDENAVIAQKVGEIHRQYDETILKATGIARVGDEKSYNYLERAGKELKAKAEAGTTLQTQIEDLNKEKARLEKAIQDGGNDAELKTQLQNVKAELDQTKGQFTELQTKLTTAEKEHNKKVFGLQVDFELNQATSGIKFKPELPESATKVLLSQALAKVKANKPDFIDDGQGGKRLVFRNEAGAVLNNPENQLNPFTASELLAKELKTMGVIDEGRKQQGAGTGGNAGGAGSGGSTTIDISGARNQIEANDAISKSLLAQGLTRGSAAYEEASTQAWKDNEVAKLPEK